MRNILFFLLLPVCLNAQNISILNAAGKVVNNDTLTLVPDILPKPPYDETKCILYARNTNTAAMNMCVKKSDIILTTGAEHGICFAKQCYLPATMISPNTSLVSPNGIDSGFSAHYRYDKSQYAPRKDLVSYTFFDANNPSDSAIVYVWYNFLPVTNVDTVTEQRKFMVTVSPNPATANLTITCSGLNDSNIKISVTNMAGVTIATQTTVSNQSGHIQMPLPNIAAGVYVITIQNGNQTITQKLVKE